MKKLLLLTLLLSASLPLYAAEMGEMATFGIALGAGLAIGLAALGGG
ncbi:MAG TPA: F0F1 ATP synthase subunit C, partial [Pseudomonadales bacterium]|nr:F0F1 ATP synthase subunit C [Pseudomonadales bacterium]